VITRFLATALLLSLLASGCRPEDPYERAVRCRELVSDIRLMARRTYSGLSEDQEREIAVCREFLADFDRKPRR
jgi:hypothetical protein